MQRAAALRLAAEPVEIAVLPPGCDLAAETALVAQVIETGRAVFQRDGGDVALVGFDGAVAWVRLSGACADCTAAPLTLLGLQQQAREALGRKVRVLPVGKGLPGKGLLR